MESGAGIIVIRFRAGLRRLVGRQVGRQSTIELDRTASLRGKKKTCLLRAKSGSNVIVRLSVNQWFESVRFAIDRR